MFEDTSIVKLNVGGKQGIVVKKELLLTVKGSNLEKQFKREIIEDEVFVDRDGETFSYLLNYLRNNRQQKPVFNDEYKNQQFDLELKHWGVEKLNQEDALHKIFVEDREHHLLPFDYAKFMRSKDFDDTLEVKEMKNL